MYTLPPSHLFFSHSVSLTFFLFSRRGFFVRSANGSAAINFAPTARPRCFFHRAGTFYFLLILPS